MHAHTHIQREREGEIERERKIDRETRGEILLSANYELNVNVNCEPYRQIILSLPFVMLQIYQYIEKCAHAYAIKL